MSHPSGRLSLGKQCWQGFGKPRPDHCARLAKIQNSAAAVEKSVADARDISLELPHYLAFLDDGYLQPLI